jgi:cytoskeletal protein RodZ
VQVNDRVWGRLVRAKFGRSLRRADRRVGVSVWGSAARGGLCPLALAIALLAVAAVPVEAGVAAPGAAPDPPPAAKGSPEPDPYRAEQPSQPRTEPVTQQPAPSSSGGSTTVSTPAGTSSTPTVEQNPQVSAPRTQNQPKKEKEVAAGRTTAPQSTKQNAKRSPSVVAAAAVDGGSLLLGGLALAALALASGSLLFLVSRSSGLEARP